MADSVSEPRPSPEGLFLWSQDKTFGPFGLAQFRALLESGKITPASLVADAPEGPWLEWRKHPALSAIAAAAAPSPFKERAFARVNAVGGSVIDHRDLIRLANEPLPGALPVDAVARQPPNDVEVLVRATSQTVAATEAPLRFEKRSNRRRRDFILLLVVGDGTGMGLAVLARHDPMFVALIAMLTAVYTASLAWIMWSIMDRS